MAGGMRTIQWIFREFMIMPVGASCFSEGIRMCVEIYQSLRILFKKRKICLQQWAMREVLHRI